MNIKALNHKDTEKLFKLALQELANNHINFAKAYFEKATIKGHKHASKYIRCLYREKDKKFARDIILCAENKI